MTVTTGTSWAPIRKVTASAVGGLPIAALVTYGLGLLGVDLPESVAGLIGAGIAALIAYLVSSAPGETGPPPATPKTYAPIDPDAS